MVRPNFGVSNGQFANFLLLFFVHCVCFCVAFSQTSSMVRRQIASSNGQVLQGRRRAPPRAHSLAFIMQQSKKALAKLSPFGPGGDVLSRPPRPILPYPSLPSPLPPPSPLPSLSPPPPIAPPSSPLLLKCLLPSDFWCDHPQIELLCTGSSQFCAAYKANRKGKGMDLKLAFESGCPDSQKLIVNQLFPKVLNHPTLSGMVDFKAIPWGLAKRRQYDHQVQCHHGSNECSANRLLSCALNHPFSDRPSRHRLLNCFMAKMMSKSEPERGMISCLANSATNPSEILNCARSNSATRLQLEDETETEQILNSPRFVPFMALNGWSHLALQAPTQLLLAEKLEHWNDTLNSVSPISKRSTLKSLPASFRNCAVPPDFWCSFDSSVTNACFDQQKCQTFHQSLYGIPVQLKVIYNSQLSVSRDYLRRYIRPQFFSGTRTQRYTQNVGKVRVELEPAAMTQNKLSECGRTATTAQCQRRILEVCVFAVSNVEQRSVQLMCINDIERWTNGDDIVTAWQRICYPPANQRKQILFCTSSESVWSRANSRLGLAQFGSLWPEQQQTDPWIVLNGLSLSTVQRYSLVLDQLICLWYRGPGHDPTQCGRCEYEPTHC